jgi:hypothetical protein
MLCESCLMVGRYVPATTRSLNPEYANYAFCEECASRYDAMFLGDESVSESKRLEYASIRYSSRHGGGRVFKVKFGGKHYKGCVCDVCGALDGNHTRLCACPYCGGKEGNHNPECYCPQCFKPNGEHHPYCECPVCHRLG